MPSFLPSILVATWSNASRDETTLQYAMPFRQHVFRIIIQVMKRARTRVFNTHTIHVKRIIEPSANIPLGTEIEIGGNSDRDPTLVITMTTTTIQLRQNFAPLPLPAASTKDLRTRLACLQFELEDSGALSPWHEELVVFHGSKRSEHGHDLEANVAETMNRRACGTRGAASREVGRRSHAREKKASEVSGNGGLLTVEQIQVKGPSLDDGETTALRLVAVGGKLL